ncbi:MAG: glutamate racemase [Clostridiales bacterium]|nr:glutamate racemase [Clostridiales bacterium]
MDNRPIGFFDSGLGGLTCIPHLMKQLPNEKMIYFGDTARTPYGSKATTTIRSFSMEIADFLMKCNVKMIVIACNTVSATCLEALRSRFPQIPILGIIEPAARKIAAEYLEDTRVGIIGTKVTIGSSAYKKSIGSFNDRLKTYEKACPAFVPLIEEGIIENDIMDLTIKYYMDEFVESNQLDAVVLGCTHYPLIKRNIERLYPRIQIINPSRIIVENIENILRESDMLAGNSDFKNVFYASDLSENFVNMIDYIFENEDAEAKVKFLNFDLEKGEQR